MVGDGEVTSKVGSPVKVKTADPLVNCAPATEWRPDPLTSYTVDPVLMLGARTVAVMAAPESDSSTPWLYTPKPKATTLEFPVGALPVEVLASVNTTCTVCWYFPGGTQALTVACPLCAYAQPPLWWMVHTEITGPGSPPHGP